MKRINQDKVFIFFNYIVAMFFLLVALYPLYYVVIASFSNPSALVEGRVMLYPVGFSLTGYKMLLEYGQIWIGYANTLLYTVAGTLLSLFITVPAGYVLSRETLPFRKFLNIFCMLTMFVHGGMIPTYLLIKNLGLTDTRILMIILGSANVWNMILCRNFFTTNIPKGIIEAARIDGCSEFKIFLRVVLPISKAIIAVMTLYFGVAHWNTYSNALFYIQDETKWPLQLVIRNILNSSNIDPENMTNAAEQLLAIESMRFSLLIVASVPLLVAYPFVQKYFVKGVTIGSVKE